MAGTWNAALLSLAWLAAVNVVVSLAVLPVWRAAARTPRPVSGGLLLALRLLPAALSVLFVAAVFAPAHWRFEPRGTDESFGVGLHVLAAAGAILIVRTLLRAAAILRAAWALRRCGRLPRITADSPSAVYELDGLHGVSLAGVVRPRILVGRSVRAVLTEPELQAAVAHELAHRAALDNVKRSLIFCAPEFLGGTAAARDLEARWAAAAEWQADARAVQGDATRAAHLASALVKVARLAATPSGWSSPAWSTLHDAPLLESRVRRLVSGAPAVERPERARVALAAAAALTLLVIGGMVAAPGVHAVTETLAHLLP